MRRKIVLVLAVVLVPAAVVGGLLYRHWAGSPRYALQQMALSLKTKDMDTFFNYLNLKEIFDNLVEASGSDQGAPEDPQADDWTRFSQRLVKKYARQLLPKVFESLEVQLRGLIEQYLRNLSDAQVMGVMAAATVAEIQPQGDEAQVTLHDPRSKNKLRFTMRRQPATRVWQIVAVDYQDIKKFIQREIKTP